MSSTFPLLRNRMLYSVPIPDTISCPVARQINRLNPELNPIVVAKLPHQYRLQCLSQTQIYGRCKVPLTSPVSPWLATTSCEFDCSLSAPHLSSRLLGCMCLVADQAAVQDLFSFAGINQCVASSPRQDAVFLWALAHSPSVVMLSCSLQSSCGLLCFDAVQGCGIGARLPPVAGACVPTERVTFRPWSCMPA
ncbi:hypothetical protein AG1IA_05395 [Rhizoctonia solani AG-1 IA]|uniref:Uncharacterized protein n=1 Tax=Thanatephorus cucumeris (strain AG1-IA) TaxID=983506 RepID=L8WRE4_THACA|nr:hypothetical protein AG1IA_05395 [Rhizoctonia solani AG-1 IA]